LDDSNNPSVTFKYSEPPEGAQEFYTNHLQVFWTGVDLTLIFGELLHSSENIAAATLAVENRAKVTMPWAVAKLILHNLTDAITRYEEKNGELKLPGQYKLP
jgi:hypothetical protein